MLNTISEIRRDVAEDFLACKSYSNFCYTLPWKHFLQIPRVSISEPLEFVLFAQFPTVPIVLESFECFAQSHALY